MVPVHFLVKLFIIFNIFKLYSICLSSHQLIAVVVRVCSYKYLHFKQDRKILLNFFNILNVNSFCLNIFRGILICTQEENKKVFKELMRKRLTIKKAVWVSLFCSTSGFEFQHFLFSKRQLFYSEVVTFLVVCERSKGWS